jgi:hypothetical protein
MAVATAYVSDITPAHERAKGLVSLELSLVLGL